MIKNTLARVKERGSSRNECVGIQDVVYSQEGSLPCLELLLALLRK